MDLRVSVDCERVLVTAGAAAGTSDGDARFAGVVSTGTREYGPRVSVSNRMGNNGHAAAARAHANCIERPVFAGLARLCWAS